MRKSGSVDLIDGLQNMIKVLVDLNYVEWVIFGDKNDVMFMIELLWLLDLLDYFDKCDYMWWYGAYGRLSMITWLNKLFLIFVIICANDVVIIEKISLLELISYCWSM